MSNLTPEQRELEYEARAALRRLLMQEDYADYPPALAAAGFSEAARMENRWFRPTGPLTAFYVNLKPEETHMHIEYGFASTAFTRFAGSENELTDLGVFHGSAGTLRGCIDVSGSPDAAREQIAAFYREYCHLDKDGLLSLISERRKAFLKAFAAPLKALGFKKKGNVWSREIAGGLTLRFDVCKSLYSDFYSLQTSVSAPGSLPRCYSCAEPAGDDLDWQLLSSAELDALAANAAQKLSSMIAAGREDLIRMGCIRAACLSPTRHCARCWAQECIDANPDLAKHIGQ